MKLLAICVVLLGGGKSAEAPDRWPEVERLATPSVPGGVGAMLDKALERVTDDDVPELALEDAIAWRKARGGIGSRCRTHPGAQDSHHRVSSSAWRGAPATFAIQRMRARHDVPRS